MEFGQKNLSLDTPKVMGVLNVTPDSFYDGGAHYRSDKLTVSSCFDRAATMVLQGASFIDIGGESTRPGAQAVSADEEMQRVLPVVERVSNNLDVVVSVDTSSAALMREAANLGAGLINDVRALERDDALQAVVDTGLPVCLMHMQGQPESMQSSPNYQSVVDDVTQYLRLRVRACVDAGIDLARIILDPGIGFGKSDAHNLALLRSLDTMNISECPLLVGVSRKSMIGRLLDRDVDQRLAGSLAFAVESVRRGARIIRVHDVAETVDVLKVYSLMNKVGD